MTTARQRVAEVATQIIIAQPGGIRWAELFRAVVSSLPNENKNTVLGSLHFFRNHLPQGITRPDRGVYAYGDVVEEDPAQQPSSAAVRHREAPFYKPFADYLVDDLEEATRAQAVGGNGAGAKWGTPDVIGLYESRPSDPVKCATEVIAVEIKADTHSLITAFGQACAYKLFAHRVYIVVPRTSNAKDLKRLDALAGVVGIGLVKFNADDCENPEFQVMVRAAKHEPDYYYTNEFLRNFMVQFGL